MIAENLPSTTLYPIISFYGADIEVQILAAGLFGFDEMSAGISVEKDGTTIRSITEGKLHAVVGTGFTIQKKVNDTIIYGR